MIKFVTSSFGLAFPPKDLDRAAALPRAGVPGKPPDLPVVVLVEAVALTDRALTGAGLGLLAVFLGRSSKEGVDDDLVTLD